MPRIILLVVTLFLSNLFAQVNRNELYTPIEYKDAYTKGTRMKDGSVPSTYWQNHSDYKIKAKIDPRKRSIKGSAVITYYNESPDSLGSLVFHTYPDLTKKGSIHYTYYPEDFKPGDETKGMIIEKLVINGQNFDVNSQTSRVYQYGTVRYVYFPLDYINPKSTNTIEVSWNYTLPLEHYDRTGALDPTTLFVGYWYPEISVCDDINGWDYENYDGTAEFYHDYSNYEVELEVPTNYIVWASVEPNNAKDIYPDFIQQNLAKAKTSTGTTPIVTKDDLKKVKMKSGIWKYSAKDFPDFTFALSDHYVWDAGSYTDSYGTFLLHSAYNPKSTEYKEILRTEQESIKKFHNEFPKYEFPYHYFTIFQGSNGGGMEFPGMANDQAISGELMSQYVGKTVNDFDAQFGLSLHEMCHMYFPFLMGINEKKYAWMDEGWATFSEYFIDGENDPGYSDVTSASLSTSPILTQTNTQPTTSFTNSYDMGALSYYSLYCLLGEDMFFKCLHSYMDQWKHKHPTPWDFFNCFTTSSQMDLNWYWKAMYFDWGYADIGISKFEKGTLELTNYGRKPISFTININFTDDTQVKETISPIVWKSTDVYLYPVSHTKEIKSIDLTTLSGADADRSNNTWFKE